MKIVNLGSINIDHVYRVEHFVRPSETLQSQSYKIFSGGKGANQSIALARAGATVKHGGKIGKEGEWVKAVMQRSGVDTGLIKTCDIPSGHAIIQVDKTGENAIILYAGANNSFSIGDIEDILSQVIPGDYVLLQNEINLIETILPMAKQKGALTVLNPAPMNEKVREYPLENVDIFIVNEIEGEALTKKKEPDAIASRMLELYPKSKTVLTLGKEGLIYIDQAQRIKMDALRVDAVDTTGAGDTFIGYFLAELSLGKPVEDALKIAVLASAICVTRHGAADSIPTREETDSFDFH